MGFKIELPAIDSFTNVEGNHLNTAETNESEVEALRRY